MRLPLALLDLGLRLSVKRRLARETSPQAMRARLEASARRFFPRPKTPCSDDVMEANGLAVPALWAQSAEPSAPLLLYLHGGAYLAGSPRTHLHVGAALAEAAGARVCLPDYRLAPEHPFPAAVEDALTCYSALLGRGHAPGRIVIAGDSAGGGLAAGLLLAATDRGLPMPAAAVLFSPWADMTGAGGTREHNARSDAMLPAHRMGDVVDFILQGADATSPLASPALGRFQAPPPMLITAGSGEILLDDARALANAVRASGGTVNLKIERGLPHAWPVFVKRLRAADRTVAEAGRFLADALG